MIDYEAIAILKGQGCKFDVRNDNYIEMMRVPIDWEGKFVVPQGVTELTGESLTQDDGDYEYYGVFGYCYDITNIVIPDSVTSIGDRAFEDCESITSVTIPNSVTDIGYSMFCGCRNLNEIVAPPHLVEKLRKEYPDINIVDGGTIGKDIDDVIKDATIAANEYNETHEDTNAGDKAAGEQEK